ncbi:hypothetical protein [Flagellimonas sp. SN16]|uniref:hypothetical protein n=1 Tax=Flagellimonas sp. SN16 TaxID=3415142 RepID=UPI003C5C494F
MAIPRDYIKDIRPGYFIEEKDLWIKSQCKPKGLNKLFTRKDYLRLDVNARILNENYKMGISLNTLDQLLDTLDIKCGLRLDASFVKESKVSTIHVKNDLDIEPLDIFDELMLIGHWSRYQRVRRENSVSYEYLTKHDKMTTTFYGKKFHMNKYKEDYEGLGINLKEFDGVTRMETKYEGWKTVKRRLGTRNLEYILKQGNINYITLTNILKQQPMQIEKIDLGQFKSLTQYQHYTMVKDLNDRYNGDITAIKSFIRGYTKRPKHQYEIVDRYLPMIKAPRGKNLTAIQTAKEQLKK